MTPAEKWTAVAPSRMKFLCLLYSDDKSESEDGVPEADRADFWDHVNYNIAFAAKWFEDVCRCYDSPTGEFETIPDRWKVQAAHLIDSKTALHELKCAYELELRRIDNREREARDAREAREREALDAREAQEREALQREHDANAPARREARRREAAARRDMTEFG